MQIPSLFKEVIKNTFYDKKVEIWTSGKLKDEDGAIIGTGKKDFVENLNCNFQFQTKEKIKQEYGEEVEANAIITCDTTIAKIGNIAVYHDVEYSITSKIISDSHTTLLVYGGGVDE